MRMSSQTPSTGGNTWSSPYQGQSHATSSYYSLVEIRPFEPREFPLSEDTYKSMQKEDQKQVTSHFIDENTCDKNEKIKTSINDLILT